MSFTPFGALPCCGRLLYDGDGLSCSCPACPGYFNMTVASIFALHILLLHQQFSWWSCILILLSSPSFLTWLWQLTSQKQLDFNINVCVTGNLKGLRLGRERNLACNQVIVAVNCSVYCVVEQKCLASLFFMCTVSVCGFCIWECIGQTITRCPLDKLCCATWPQLGSQVLQPEINSILSSNGFTLCQRCQQLAKCKILPHPSQEIRQCEGRM